MKKLLFAIQGLIIVAMFPVYIVLEINHHAKKGLGGNKKNSTYTVDAEKWNLRPGHISRDKDDHGILLITK